MGRMIRRIRRYSRERSSRWVTWIDDDAAAAVSGFAGDEAEAEECRGCFVEVHSLDKGLVCRLDVGFVVDGDWV